MPQCHAEASCSQPVRLSVCYQTCELDILKTDKPILMQIGISGPRGEGVKWSTNFGVRRSKFKVTWCQIYIWRPGSGITVDPLGRDGFSSYFSSWKAKLN